MEYKPCYEDIVSLVESGTKQFGTKFKLNQEKFTKLEQICPIVDKIVLEFECDCVDVVADEASKTLDIGIECSDMTVEDGRTHDFFQLLGMIDSFQFSVPKADTLRIDFCLDRMWERV